MGERESEIIEIPIPFIDTSRLNTEFGSKGGAGQNSSEFGEAMGIVQVYYQI